MINQKEGYSLRKGNLLSYLEKYNIDIKDIAESLGINDTEFIERLDDWDYFSAEEIERIVHCLGAKAACEIIHFPTKNEKYEVRRKTFGREVKQKRGKKKRVVNNKKTR